MLSLYLKTTLDNRHVEIKDNAYPQRDGSLEEDRQAVTTMSDTSMTTVAPGCFTSTEKGTHFHQGRRK